MEFCRLASYLQCTSLLGNALLPGLVAKVQDDNALDLCELADELYLPLLLQGGRDHIYETINSIVWAGDGDYWSPKCSSIFPRLKSACPVATLWIGKMFTPSILPTICYALPTKLSEGRIYRSFENCMPVKRTIFVDSKACEPCWMVPSIPIDSTFPILFDDTHFQCLGGQ